MMLFDVPRTSGYQGPLLVLMTACGLSSYGWGEKDSSSGFENDVFLISPYTYNECTCPEDGLEMIDTAHWETSPLRWQITECQSCKPNFYFKPTGYELRWYKYPLRSADHTQDLSPVEFLQVINQCLASLEPK